MSRAMELEDLHGPATYQRFPITAVRGSGAVLWDEQGNEYIDCMGGYGVAIVGHCNPDVVNAIRRQAETLITCHGSLYNDKRGEFLDKLTAASPHGLDAAYLSNSGAEAVEVAIKLAKKFTGKKGMIAMKGGYHGKTSGALSATWSKKYKESFEPLLPNFKHAEYGDLEAVQREVDEDTCAVILEPIQGEGGIIVPPDGYLRGVRELCDKRGLLMIADEIQTGLGRTGKMWACENWNVVPDIMTLAKGLAGGVPIGATLTRSEILHSFKRGEQTSTFGGNPLACAAGSATLDFIQREKLPDRARLNGEKFLSGLRDIAQRHKLPREARGMGMMLAFEMRVDIQEILMQSLQKGVVFTYSGRNVVRLLPPLVMTSEQIARVLSVLEDVVSSEEAKRAG
ncbi:MAG: aspartate aminotransferase family protein [Thaumarchaeota archaeon]|nr:aspartate aminotransferase family protein [Nitrososphaerota archaeon]